MELDVSSPCTTCCTISSADCTQRCMTRCPKDCICKAQLTVLLLRSCSSRLTTNLEAKSLEMARKRCCGYHHSPTAYNANAAKDCWGSEKCSWLYPGYPASDCCLFCARICLGICLDAISSAQASNAVSLPCYCQCHTAQQLSHYLRYCLPTMEYPGDVLVLYWQRKHATLPHSLLAEHPNLPASLQQLSAQWERLVLAHLRE